MWHQPPVALFVSALARDDEVGTGRIEGTDESIDISA
jgi:hypothetical protein